MKFSIPSLLAMLATSAAAQDLLFFEGMDYREHQEAIELGYSTKIATAAEWAAMTTEDFARFRAIIVPDPNCGSVSQIQFLEDSKARWSPAVTGNIILIGTDPSYHFSQGKAKTLIDNSLRFAASGTTPAGVPQTGLYFALSCYYEDAESAPVSALSYFGDFTVRGNLACYNNVHLVASSGAMESLDDVSLSDWSCSVHEAFSSYPSVGANGFQALAIARDILGVGSQTFGDGSVGLPYVLSRGATPAKCGDGVWDAEFGEECDDGNILNGDGCSLSCKCESGLPRGDGTCAPGNTTTPTGPTGTRSSYPPTGSPTDGYPPYVNVSATLSYHPSGYPTYTPPPYATPSCPTGPKIIGEEYIVEVTYSATGYVPCATTVRPIYDVSTSILPCYACALSSESITYGATDFVTVTTTICPKCEGHALPTPLPPVVYPCKTCDAYTITATDCITDDAHSASGYTEYPGWTYVAPTPHVHSSHAVEYTAVPLSTAYPARTLTPVATYKTSEKPTVTGTGAYYPTATAALAEFTGAANSRGNFRIGVVGGILLAVQALL